MVVVDYLNERFDLRALRLAGFRHSPCHGARISLNTGNERMGKRMLFRSCVLRLDDYDPVAT